MRGWGKRESPPKATLISLEFQQLASDGSPSAKAANPRIYMEIVDIYCV